MADRGNAQENVWLAGQKLSFLQDGCSIKETKTGMRTVRKRNIGLLLRYPVLGIAMLLFTVNIMAQEVKWAIASPEENSVIGNQNLFGSMSVLPEYSFDENTIRVLLDGVTITPLVRVSGNRLSFIYESRLTDGKHRLEVRAVIKEVKTQQRFAWDFFVNTREGGQPDTLKNEAPAVVPKEKWKVSGVLTADNRNEFISGSGKNLRQEPSYTRSVSLDMQIRYKNAVMPVKIFTTSDNRFTTQTQNYYQAGFHNKWLELDVGDMNPAIDRLVLTGIRMRGVRVALRLKNSSLQFFYGNMNDAYEGRLEKYISGIGVLPTNLISDSVFIVSGTYKRRMMALRLEFGSRNGNIKVGLNALKVKDAVNSITYGLQPKDNFAGGGDVSLKFFKKKLVVNAGIAASIITNDISYGVLDPKHFDSLYNIRIHFDPQRIEKLIIVNTSTIPTYSGNRDFLAWYSQLTYTNSFQSFNAEYRRNGGLYTSLGNPFLRNNYDGFSVSERIHLLKRKISVTGNYQQFSNNLNAAFASRVYTDIFNGSFFMNLGSKVPTLFISYLQQGRDSRNLVKNTPALKDRIQNLSASLNTNLGAKQFNNSLRATFNYNERNDLLRAETKIVLYNYMAGWGLSWGKQYSLNADAGKLIIQDNDRDKISDVFSYSVVAQWKTVNQKVYASGSVANNRILATLFSTPSTRLAVSVRTGFKFLKGMALDLEGGIQPYRESYSVINDFTEKYIYVRYTYNFGNPAF